MTQHPGHVMAPDELVKVHGDVLIVLAAPDDVLTLLQQTGEAEEHQEWVTVTKLRGRGQPTENIE